MQSLEIIDAGDHWQQYQISSANRFLSYADVTHAWRYSSDFQDLFGRWLAEVAYRAYFFEVRPVCEFDFDLPFEFVLAHSDHLGGITADPIVFEEWFFPNTEVVSFPNLGSDAVLVAPCPANRQTDYAHLAAFARTATLEQNRALWLAVGESVEQHCSSQPLWLSTSGLGVSWLHVRLDRYPKYYTHAPYR